MAKTTVFTCSWRRAFLLIIAIAIALGVALLFQGRMAYADDAQGSLTDEEFATQDAAEDENAAQSEANDEFAMQNEPEAQDEMDDELAVQDESDADRVRAAINALSDDPTTYTAADKDRIEAILADFESLSAEDQVAVDTGAYTGSASGQSLGRILEAALWAVWSYETDPSTTLINGTYTTETERAVSSISNKGKSDSPRVRNWWVESVEAMDGQAVANIYVTSGAATDKKLATYPSVWIAGITVDRSADNTYTIPIDLNGKTYFGGISSSMPTPIMYELETTIDETPPEFTVTFTDGLGDEPDNVLSSCTVVWGGEAVPPELPDREDEGFVFAGWDKPLDNITEDTTINALWREKGSVSFKVTFLDGWRTAPLKTEIVVEGGAATAPDVPDRPGYTFLGWDPKVFDDIMGDLTVTAQWVSDEELALAAAQEAIAALPSNSQEIAEDVNNELVSSAVAAYNALSDASKAQLTADELLHLAKCAIIVLPRDAFAVGREHEQVIAAAQAVYDSLPQNLRDQLDDENNHESRVSDSRTYGRHLESAVWALDALGFAGDSTSLGAGTYTKGIKSESNMGKSLSARKRVFSVKSLVVESGRVYAIIEYESNTADLLSIGGTLYKNDETDSKKPSFFKIPVQLNTPFHFSMLTKNANANTDAIAYEMVITADESKMEPDQEVPDPGKTDDPGSAAAPGKTDIPGKSDNSQSSSSTVDSNWYQAAWLSLLNLLSNSKPATNTTNNYYQYPPNGQQGNGGNSTSANNASNNRGQQNSGASEQGDEEASNNSRQNSANNSVSSGSSNKIPSSSNTNSASTGKTASGSSSSGSGSTSSSGNLSSLLRNSATGASSNTSKTSTSKNSSSTSASKSSASKSSDSKSSASKSSGSKSSDSKSSASAKEGDDGGSTVQEVEFGEAEDTKEPEESPDLSPALAGGSLLGISLGFLTFVLRFVRREGAPV